MHLDRIEANLGHCGPAASLQQAIALCRAIATWLETQLTARDIPNSQHTELASEAWITQ